MKRILSISLGLILISDFAFSQLKLEIEITEIRSDSGKIMIQLYDENKLVITQEMVPIKDKKCSFSIADLKPGKYGFQYYHDENSNGKLDTNLIGLPIEGYGFSNDAKVTFGPPPFEKWLFELKEDKKIELKIIY